MLLVYVDASEACNNLIFQLDGDNSMRMWNIKVTQYTCDYPNLAPKGCTQYFFGQTSDTVRTFNYAGGQHLADQDQSICVRRESGNCKICWVANSFTDFAVSGDTAATAASGTVSKYHYKY